MTSAIVTAVETDSSQAQVSIEPHYLDHHKSVILNHA